MFNKTKIKIDEYNVSKIESEDGFTMFLEDMGGGPIISDINEKNCESKFREALGLMDVVMKLISFSKTGKLEAGKLTNYKNN